LRAPGFDFKHTTFAASLLLALVTLSACATAPAPFDPLPMGRSVNAPTGFLQFCQRRPDQCQAAEPGTDRSSVGELSTTDLTRGLAPVSLIFQRPAPMAGDLFAQEVHADDGAWPHARLVLLDNRVDAKPALRYTTMDMAASMAIEPPAASPFADQPPRNIYEPLTRDASGARLRLSADLQSEIAHVDLAINRAITPRTDMEAFGVDNYWTLPLTDGPRAEGNCKHYALEKRRRLVADGVPADALSLAIVTTPANEVHAVLVISTDQGDLVLDNLTDAIRPWRQTSYHWLVRQTPAAPLRWVEAD